MYNMLYDNETWMDRRIPHMRWKFTKWKITMAKSVDLWSPYYKVNCKNCHLHGKIHPILPSQCTCSPWASLNQQHQCVHLSKPQSSTQMVSHLTPYSMGNGLNEITTPPSPSLGFVTGTGKPMGLGSRVWHVQVQYLIWHTCAKPHTHATVSWVCTGILLGENN